MPEETAATRFQALARLHVSCLPESLISLLGLSFANQFYRFIETSKTEHLGFIQDQNRIIGAYVLSYAPDSLFRRLLFNTWLIFWAPLALVRPPLLRAILEAVSPTHGEGLICGPELLLIFVADDQRSKGIGQKLLALCEQELQDNGYDRYFVRTLDDTNNLAHKVYVNVGFTRVGLMTHGGRKLAVLEKRLPEKTTPGE